MFKKTDLWQAEKEQADQSHAVICGENRTETLAHPLGEKQTLTLCSENTNDQPTASQPDFL